MVLTTDNLREKICALKNLSNCLLRNIAFMKMYVCIYCKLKRKENEHGLFLFTFILIL